MPRKKGAGAIIWVDPDDAPELTDEYFKSADLYEGGKLIRRGRPPVGDRPKEAIKLRLSPSVLEHFRATGPGWQTRINTALEDAVGRDRRVDKAGINPKSIAAKRNPAKLKTAIKRGQAPGKRRSGSAA
jgi:uncharacterized protein (DUF4415 family)